MKIGALVHMYPPIHNAGAEHMLHAMLLYAVEQGHTAIVVLDGPYVAAMTAPYELDGVRVTTDKRALRGIDVLLTQLDCTADAEKMAEKRGIPLVQIFHNDSKPPRTKRCDLAVYNSEWLIKHAPLPADMDTEIFMLHPPVWPERYKVESTREFITLINLQKAKGVDMFYRLAHDMPTHKFLGVMGGYGQQTFPPAGLRNVTIMETQPDAREIYRRTKILLMPSSYESYGRCAVEAAVSGIPTIAHPTMGLREALGEYGTFPVPDSPSWKCAIEYVEDTYQARVRDALWIAKNLDPEGDMDRFLAALERTVARCR